MVITDTNGNVYVGISGGCIMHTVDFNTWTEVAIINDESIALLRQLIGKRNSGLY